MNFFKEIYKGGGKLIGKAIKKAKQAINALLSFRSYEIFKDYGIDTVSDISHLTPDDW